MKEFPRDQKNGQSYYEIIALWAVCEAFAGGIMHAVKMPFSGMVISSLSVICISLLAKFSGGRMHIIRATIIVCVFKLTLSPHSPPTAYLAVGFQGLLGQVLFLRGFSSAGAVTLGFLALVESSIQRIIVLVFIYGTTFWNAVNEFLKKNFDPTQSHDYLISIAVIYMIFHGIVGIACGMLASYIGKNAGKWAGRYPHLLITGDFAMNDDYNAKRKRSRFHLLLWASWLAAVLLYIQASMDPGRAILPLNKLSEVLVRALIIVAGWYLVISPLMMRFIKKRLMREKGRLHEEIRMILDMIPRTRHVFVESIRLSGSTTGLARIRLFVKILIINTLYSEKNR